MIKLVVFDLDGVLIDSKELHYVALNLALSEIDSKFIITKEEHLNRFDGLSTKKKMEILVKERGFPEYLVNTVQDSKQRKTAGLLDTIQPDVQKCEIFKELKKRGYKIAIASNAIRNTVVKSLIRLGLYDYLDVSYEQTDIILSNEDVYRPKPAAEIYMRACLHAKVDPTETLVLEDSAIGRQAAKSAGCHLFPVKDPYSWTKEDLFRAIESQDQRGKLMWTDKKLNVVIPMAGAGSRFEKVGYTFPKPLIEVRGKPMIQVVVENLGLDANFIFIAQNSHIEKYNLKTLLNLIAPNCKLIGIDGITEGAACTVLKAEELIDNDSPLLIANSDQFLEWNPTDFYYSMEADKTVDGGIVTFKATHPKWSFAEIQNGFVTRVAEKNPISDNATVGVYYWKRGFDFVNAATRMISNNDRTNNEFYVAPVFNWAINSGLKFKPYEIEKMWGIGVPEDLNYFLENYKGNV